MAAPRNPVPERSPSLAHALMVVLMLTIISTATIMAIYSVDEEAPIGTHALQWVIMAVNAVLVVSLVLFGVLRPAKLSAAELGWGKLVPARDIPWALAALVVASLFPIGVALVTGGGMAAVVDAMTAGPALQRLAFVTIGLLASFAEESVFRGLLQPALVRRLGAPLGIGLTCVIFSLYHLPKHPFAFVGRVLTGLAYGTAAYRTKALWAGAIGHFLTWTLLGAL